MDDQREKRREQLPEHETRPEQGVGGGMVGAAGTAEETVSPDPERLAALPEHERDTPAAGASAEYERLSSDEATEIDEAALDLDDADNDDQVPPITRSG